MARRLADRYGLGGGEADATAPNGPQLDWTPPAWNPTLDLILSHRSVRRFLDRPLPDGVPQTLAAAAQSAPSSSNLQTWSVLAVTDPERKARLSRLAGDQAFIRQAPLLLVWLLDQHRLRYVGRAQNRPVEALDYVESFLLGAVDTALAAQNATVAAESLGLGAVYVGAIRNRPAEVAAELDLPPHVVAVVGMAVGWPDPDAGLEVKPRLPQAAVLFHETYAWTDAQTAAVEAYNPRIRAFQQRQAMPQQDWTTQALTRTAGPASMAGRHVLREVLGGLGFELR
ncbi:nitroreductase family protein [Caulobacter sp. KR2-114]|uniref:nitroreductase family protein n=1 Tax=Caulobacter sp. KR2-114 TaxID=3400912 RepID=UPI003BFDC519